MVAVTTEGHTPTDERRFTGAVGVASEEGRSIVLTTHRGQVQMTLPGDDFGGAGASLAGRDTDRQYCLSSEEAWCLAQQLLLAVRRAER